MCIYPRDDLQAEELNVPNPLGCNSLVESLWMKVKLDKKKLPWLDVSIDHHLRVMCKPRFDWLKQCCKPWYEWDMFADNLINVVNLHAPSRRLRVHNERNPPATNDILDLVEQTRGTRNIGNVTLHNYKDTVAKRAIWKDCRGRIWDRLKNGNSSEVFFFFFCYDQQ